MYLTKREARETGRDYALRTLKDNIIRLELEPGTMVSENELAAEMGLSRTPVREALIELNKVKIVEIYPQRGSGIAKVDFSLVEEAEFLRVTLESAALARCCERGLASEDRSALLENLKLQDFYLNHRGMKLFELDNEFHHRLFQCAKLSNAYSLMNGMTIHLDRVRTMHLIAAKELMSVKEHHRIMDAVVRGDAEAAKEILQRHIAHYQADEDVIRERYPQYIK